MRSFGAWAGALTIEPHWPGAVVSISSPSLVASGYVLLVGIITFFWTVPNTIPIVLLAHGAFWGVQDCPFVLLGCFTVPSEEKNREQMLKTYLCLTAQQERGSISVTNRLDLSY